MRSLRLARNSIAVIEDTDYIRQRVLERLRFIQREWFLDISLGVPFYTLLGRQASPSLVAVELANEVRKIEGVLDVRISDLELEPDNGMLGVELEVDTERGTIRIGADIGAD